MTYAGPCLSRAAAIMNGPDIRTNEPTTWSIALNCHSIANNHIRLRVFEIPRRIKFPRGRGCIHWVDLQLEIQSFGEWRPTWVDMILRTQPTDDQRVRSLTSVCRSHNKEDREPVPLDYSSLIRNASLDLNARISLFFDLDLSTLVACSECNRYMTQSKLQEHREMCCSLTRCSTCDAIFTYHTYVTRHLISGHGSGRPICPFQVNACPRCRILLATGEHKNHEADCPEMVVADTCWCSSVQPIKKTRTEWIQHRSVCEYKPIDCVDCKQTMPIRLLANHFNLDCLNRMITKRCECCLDERQAPVSLTRAEWKTHICWRVALLRLEARVRELEIKSGITS